MNMDKKRIDIMTDIETLGKDVDCTVFQIAAVSFDITTGEILDTFNVIADISKEKLNAEGSTIKWWLDTDKELLHKLLSSGTCSESEMFQQFHDWMVAMSEECELHLWGNGPLFDNNIIRSHMVKAGLTYPIKYNKDRDVRTIVELASMKTGLSEKELREKYYDKRGPAHDAFNDVINQIRIVHNSYKILMENNQ